MELRFKCGDYLCIYTNIGVNLLYVCIYTWPRLEDIHIYICMYTCLSVCIGSVRFINSYYVCYMLFLLVNMLVT